MEREEVYKKIVKKNTEFDFLSPAKDTISRCNEIDPVILSTTSIAIAPVMVSYVLWVLKDAEQKNIKRLYFLARDGYVYYKIAEKLCQAWQLNVECKYLYCSRRALRQPLFWIDKENALDQLCIDSVYVNLKSILQRAGIGELDQKEISNQLQISLESHLSINKLQRLKQQLNSCTHFIHVMEKNSKDSYDNIILYFRQEGLFENSKNAFVDSGWMGSMQKTFRKLIEFESKKKEELQGYYFGMYKNTSLEDGKYYSYYFSPNKSFQNAVWFNNNLFECLSGANHGMTIGYINKEKAVIPELKKYKAQKIPEWNLKIYDDYCDSFIKYNKKPICWNDKKTFHMCHKLLKTFMSNPSYEEAKAYGKLSFSDDPSESFVTGIAEELNWSDLKYMSVFHKILKKIWKSKTSTEFRMPFWAHGALRLSVKNEKIYFWYRIDMVIMNWVRCGVLYKNRNK